ncbi:MAG: hypothetical protein QMB20_06325 [Flavobacteriales bacterium]|jgi:hypothetical protein|tara:strand:+ start:2559 stop:3062 length:504 start_codon:yes stop_codon:yes gene_type:complete
MKVVKDGNININLIAEGEGLGELKFGLQREDVELLLGEPDEKESFSYTESEEDETESWHFDELELSLGFDKEDDWRLVTIAITSADYKFLDFTPIGLSKEEFKSKLKDKGVDDLGFDDLSSSENPSHELIFSDKLGMNFWFDEDSLSEVQWSPHFIDDDTVKWPELK